MLCSPLYFFFFFFFLSALKRFSSFLRPLSISAVFYSFCLKIADFFQVRKIAFFSYLTKQILHFFYFFYPFYPSNPFNRYFCGCCCGYCCGYYWAITGFFSLKRLVFSDFYPLSILPIFKHFLPNLALFGLFCFGFFFFIRRLFYCGERLHLRILTPC